MGTFRKRNDKPEVLCQVLMGLRAHSAMSSFFLNTLEKSVGPGAGKERYKQVGFVKLQHLVKSVSMA